MGEVRTLVGRGIYDSPEVARLSGAPQRCVSRWASAPSSGGGLLFPTDRRLFTFWDLVTATVVHELLRTRRVTSRDVRTARDYLSTRVDNPWPLAHLAGLRRLGTDGRSVYYRTDDGVWLDAALHGQAPFEPVKPALLDGLSFDNAGLAESWRPREGVVLRPAVQAGTPCVEGTRVSTRMLAGLTTMGEDVDDIASDYDLNREQVLRAIEFERSLEQAA